MSSRHSISIFRASAGIEHAPYRKEAPSTPGEEPILVERLAGALDAKSLPTRKSKESIVASAPRRPPPARAALGLPWSDRKERRYQRFAAMWRSRPVNWLWDHLPMRLRYNKFAQAGYAR